VSTSGARLWRSKNSLHGREKLLALGQYPDVPLVRARQKRDEARRLVADVVDPAVQRLFARNAKADTFAVIASEWLGLQRKRFAPATMEKAEWSFRDLINPYIAVRRQSTDRRDHAPGVARQTRSCIPHETALRPSLPLRRCYWPRAT
jgi:Arm domain-containing DNA-binding protein